MAYGYISSIPGLGPMDIGRTSGGSCLALAAPAWAYLCQVRDLTALGLPAQLLDNDHYPPGLMFF